MTAGICDFAEFIPGVTNWSAGNSGRVGFCDHIAAGWMSTMRRQDFWNGVGVSAHFCIGKDGSIIQLVNLFDTAWAQGRLGPIVIWPPYGEMKAGTGTSNPNAWLISTEHEGFPADEWTPAMLDADIRVKRWCIEECERAGFNALQFGIDSLAGHFMFDQMDRPSCPGPHWPRGSIWAALQDGGDDLSAEERKELEDARITLALAGARDRLTWSLSPGGSYLVKPGPTRTQVEWVTRRGVSFQPPIYIPVDLVA